MYKKNRGWLWFMLVPLTWWATTQIGYAKNVTGSMPEKHFLIRFSKNVGLGDYITFVAPNGSYYKGLNITKKVVGMYGDRVTTQNNNVYVNGKFVASAKTHSKTGEPLTVIKSGVIPKGHYFVWVNHQDSYDSRYQDIGLVNEKQIIGVSYPLW
jgi:conjugal transfer pilin signal peptidase TrbI